MQKTYLKEKQYNFNDIKNKQISEKTQYLVTFPLASISYSYMANVKQNIKKYYNNFNMQFENSLWYTRIFTS